MSDRATRKHVRGEYDRVWLSDDYFDLIVWYASGDVIRGLQLCYGKPVWERAFIWTSDRGFSHKQVDDGEARGWANQTPILLPDGSFPADSVAAEFRRRSVDLPVDLRELVLGKIAEYVRLRNV
ncbi:MAG: hypothetical protein ACREFF_04315 [Candidatus Udaeobacter sp.]